MAGANRLQVRPRGVAAITAVWLVLCGVLAMRHEATTAHVGDGAGGYVHARVLAERHRGADSDFHGQRDPEADAGHCAILTGFHQPASAASAAPIELITVDAVRVPDLAHSATPRARGDVYRLAPKTSPPRAG